MKFFSMCKDASKPFLSGTGCPEEKHLNPFTFLKFSLFTTITPSEISFSKFLRRDNAVFPISTEALPTQIGRIFLKLL